jgi:hypothetical protein
MRGFIHLLVSAGHNQLPKLIQGVRFTDEIEVAANPALSKAQTAAA